MDKFRQFIYRMRAGIARFMYGRNGQDDMGRFFYIAGFVFLILNIFIRSSILSAVTTACFVYCLFRMLSKNIARRRDENARFLKWMEKPARYWKRTKMRWRDRKTHRYYVCKSCGQMIRVPKGKGKIEITCPKCRNKFIKKT